MKDRCLSAAVKANAVARGFEKPDERCDEAVVGHSLGELVIDREKRRLLVFLVRGVEDALLVGDLQHLEKQAYWFGDVILIHINSIFLLKN